MLRKTRRQILSSPKGSDFAPQNKEANPLLAKGSDFASQNKESVMDEKLYKKVKGIGASNLAFGIITLVFGITAGVMLIVNGARLLAHKSDSLI